MNRRTFFAATLAPLADRFAPKAAVVKPSSPMLDALTAYTLESILPQNTEMLFRHRTWGLNSRDNSCFRGGGHLA